MMTLKAGWLDRQFERVNEEYVSGRFGCGAKQVSRNPAEGKRNNTQSSQSRHKTAKDHFDGPTR
jgi:hypothetical protein